MSTYIPGIQDYIPQAQPFQPDYNFLGNILQTKQSQYDKNYKLLNNQYAQLLNSPMTREDNIKQREEFFKMIDGDIKRISGMDLSLQQNVDSANKVFDSFLENKNMVHDMVFTKEFQNQLQVAENYRNCTDQDKCGGLPWEEGKQALYYKAEEYKNATKEEALKMAPGKYVPRIDLTQEALKWGKDFFSKSGGFGIEQEYVKGGYLIKDKNGALLQTPLENILLNVYGKDQRVKDMYQTQAYVQRKNYIGNLVKEGMDPSMAEAQYFNEVDGIYKQAVEENEILKARAQGLSAKHDVIKKEIKLQGSTGQDALAKALWSTGVDKTASQQTADLHNQMIKEGESIYTSGDDIELKRQRADGFVGNHLLKQAAREGSKVVADLTFQRSMQADPYAKSLFDFQLDMKKQLSAANLQDRNDYNKQMRKFMLNKKMAELTIMGDPEGSENNFRTKAAPGTTSLLPYNAAMDQAEFVTGRNKRLIQNKMDFNTNYTNVLNDIINSSHDSTEKLNAQADLQKIWGMAKYDRTGKVLSPGYDAKTQMFVGKNGTRHTDPGEIIGDYDQGELYARSYAVAQSNKNVTSHKFFLDGEGAVLQNRIKKQQAMYNVASQKFRNNNISIRNFGYVDPIVGKELHENTNTKLAWQVLIDKNGNIATPEAYGHEFVKQYIKQHAGETNDTELYNDAMDAARKEYSKASQNYFKLFNAGISKGTDKYGKKIPLVESIRPSIDGFDTGISAGNASVGMFNANHPGSFGSRGLITFNRDVSSDENAMFTFGLPGSPHEVKNSDTAKEIWNTVMSDFLGGDKKVKQSLVGNIQYLDLAVGDPNKVAVNITLPQSYLDKYKDSAAKKHPTWADDPSLSTTGITVIIDKDKASNDFTAAHATTDEDYMINMKGLSAETPGGGKLNIGKRNPDGSLVVDGHYVGYELGEDGKYKERLLPQSKIYRNDPSAKDLLQNIQATLNAAAKANTEFKQQNPQGFYDNWKDILKYQITDNEDEEVDYDSEFAKSIGL